MKFKMLFLAVLSLVAIDSNAAERGRVADAESTMLEDAAGALIEGASGEVGGDAAGWVMGMLVGNDSTKDLEQIKAQLAQQTQMLQNITAKLDQLSGQIDQAKDQILDAVDRANYETGARILEEPVARIKSLYQRLQWLSQADPKEDNGAEVLRLNSDIKATVLADMMTIHELLVDTDGVTGLMPLWGKIMAKGSGFPRFVQNGYLKPVHQQFDYYYGVQIMGLNLVVEAYHSDKPANTRMAQNYADAFTASVNVQKAYLPEAVLSDDSVVKDTKTGLMWMRGYAKYENGSPWVMSYDGELPALVATRPGGFGDWRAPSPENFKTLVAGAKPSVRSYLNENGFAIDMDGSFFTSEPSMFFDFKTGRLEGDIFGSVILVRTY